MKSYIMVPYGEFRTAKGDNILRTSYTGAGICVALIDITNRIGALANIQFPTEISKKMSTTVSVEKLLEEMLGKMLDFGGFMYNIRAKLAGGATLKYEGTEEFYDIGRENLNLINQTLSSMNIPVSSVDTGGQYSRQIELHCSTGRVIVRSLTDKIEVL